MVDTIIIIAMIALDQLSKRGILQSLGEYGSKELFPWLNLSLTYNTGAAWSFLANQSWGIYLLTACSVVASLILVIYFYSHKQKLLLEVRIAFVLLIAGSVGNLLDRLILGKVIDFVDFHIASWHFPTFNLADSYLTIAIALCLVLSMLGRLDLPLFTAEQPSDAK